MHVLPILCSLWVLPDSLALLIGWFWLVQECEAPFKSITPICFHRDIVFGLFMCFQSGNYTCFHLDNQQILLHIKDSTYVKRLQLVKYRFSKPIIDLWRLSWCCHWISVGNWPVDICKQAIWESAGDTSLSVITFHDRDLLMAFTYWNCFVFNWSLTCLNWGLPQVF